MCIIVVHMVATCCHALLNARLTLDPKIDQSRISASSAKLHGLSIRELRLGGPLNSIARFLSRKNILLAHLTHPPNRSDEA